MNSTAEQQAAFLAGSGIEMPALKILFASLLMSLVLVFVMVLMRNSFRSWSKEYIDTADFFVRVVGLIFILLIIVYLVN